MSETEKSSSTSAINLLFVLFIGGAIVFAAFSGEMKGITDESFQAAKESVNLAIRLIGIMALWLGLVRILEAGGFMFTLAGWFRPLMIRLFPDVPSQHPAMGAMLLNMSANMLGLGNAATPFGIKAMVELNRLNPLPGTATNAMCLFLAINTSSVTILPLGVIGVRAAAGAADPAGIFLPTLFATLTSTVIGVSLALLLARRDRAYAEKVSGLSSMDSPESVSEGASEAGSDQQAELEKYASLVTTPPLWMKGLSVVFLLGFAAALIRALISADDAMKFVTGELASFWLMPGLMLLIVSYGLYRGVRVYEAVTEGAKQGFDIAVKIIPFLVAILVAIGMFRASGAMLFFTELLTPLTSLIGMPADVLPMALVRPLSGSGAFGVMSELVSLDPNSFSAFLSSTMQGSTETTFYVLAVYFGAVGIVRVRHAVIAALAADFAGILASCLFAGVFWSGAPVG